MRWVLTALAVIYAAGIAFHMSKGLPLAHAWQWPWNPQVNPNRGASPGVVA